MANIPEWLCRYPYERDEKRPYVMRREEMKLFLYTETFPETSDLNWLITSTDYMTVGEYQLAPGSHFSPADVHAGDEIYYVLRGEVTLMQPEIGQTLVIRQGEGVLMPKRCPHIGYNFGESEARMLFMIAPKSWDEKNDIPLEYTGAMKTYQYTKQQENLQNCCSKETDEACISEDGRCCENTGWRKAATVDDLGAFPVSGPLSRKERLFYKLTEENSIRMISGEKTPALLSVWCSNDLIQFGTIRLLSGGAGPQQTEFDTHAGDAVFYVLDSPMTFFIKDRNETYDVQPGEYMVIPEGETYKIINYYGKTTKAVFAVAPKF